MTLHELLRSMAHRWYVVVVVLGVAMLSAFGLMRDGGLYATRTVVTFTLPGQPSLLPDSGTGDPSIISFAAAVAEEINGGRAAATYATADAPFYGAGIRQGMSVALPNFGGQWTTSFSRAEIEIQIVGRTEQWVATRQSDVLAQVERIAQDQQINAGTNESARVQTSVAPLTTQIVHVESSPSARIVAFGAMAAAALLIAGWAALALDRLSSRRRRRVSQRYSVVDQGESYEYR